MSRSLLLTAVLGALLALALAQPGLASAGMYMGAAEDEGRNADPAVAMAKMDLAKAAGFDTIRVTAIWAPGEAAAPQDQRRALQAAAAAALFDRIKLVVTIMPYGSRTTPLTAKAQRDFARFSADVVRRLPTVHEYIVGNEPNLNRYWLPQFGPDGTDVAATSYESLLARSYDAIKGVDKRTFVMGGSVSPRGGDDPSSTRLTHSPTTFITDLGAAYRASGRPRPIMDGFAFHPYGESSSTPPTLTHPNSTSIGLADYPKLVALLGDAFDGTPQLGSKLPIVYDEYGIDSQIPEAKLELYHGREPSTTHPVPEAEQADMYREALMIAACQPTVRGFLIFHVTDEPDFNRWQSGMYYPDGAAKSSLGEVRQTIRQIRAGQVDCPVESTQPNGGGADGWVLASSKSDRSDRAKGGRGARTRRPEGGWVLVKAS